MNSFPKNGSYYDPMTPRFESDASGTFFGYYIAAPGGRWVTQDGKVTREWSRRGLWPTEAAAREALERMPVVIEEEQLTTGPESG